MVRCCGGSKKYRGLRLDHGNYSWGSVAITRKNHILDVVYNASNNELVRTKTLVKNCIVQIDSIRVGDRVYVYTPAKKTGTAYKFACLFVGPTGCWNYMILE